MYKSLDGLRNVFLHIVFSFLHVMKKYGSISQVHLRFKRTEYGPFFQFYISHVIFNIF